MRAYYVKSAFQPQFELEDARRLTEQLHMGLTDFRVRTAGESAKLQVPAAQLPVVLEHRREILRLLAQEYDAVTLDLKTRDE